MTQENSKKKWSANAEKSEADNGQSLGAFLQRERQKKQLSIQEVADATRIPQESLLALEAGHRHLLPVSVFTRGFVKIYAAHLGLDQAEILERFSNEWGTVENQTPEILSGESMAESSPFFLSFHFYFLLLLIGLTIGLAYFFFQADTPPPPASLTAVPFSMEQPEEQMVVKDNTVTQLEINPTPPSQETLLVSPHSAGKIVLEEDEGGPADSSNPQTATSTDTELKQASPPSNVSARDATAAPKETLAQQATPPAAPASVIKKSTAVAAKPKPALFNKAVHLHIRFLKRTHISVAQDDGRPEKFIFTAGEESTWQAASHISLQVDDADAVELTLNGAPISVADSNNGPLAITLPTDLDH